MEFASADAAGAEVHGFPAAIGLDMDLLQVRQPAPPGKVVRVADLVPADGFLVATETFFGHGARIIPDFAPVDKGAKRPLGRTARKPDSSPAHPTRTAYDAKRAA